MVRTLLVASQKGGVGKTTTAVNLATLAAQAGARVLLIDADPLGSVASSLQLSRNSEDKQRIPDCVTGKGVVWQNIVSGLDAVSPYPAEDTTEERLAEFLSKIPSSSLAKKYDRIVIDAPPMLGPRPKNLLKAADDVIIVQRAEPMSFRTLPVYLDLLRTVKKEGARCELKGILLTLPPGLPLGSKAEQTLREKFRGLLPVSISFGQEVNQALVLGRPLADSHPNSSVVHSYRLIAAALGIMAPVSRVAEVGQLVGAGVGSGGAYEGEEYLEQNHEGQVLERADVNHGDGLVATKAEIMLNTEPAVKQKNKLSIDPEKQASPSSELIWLSLGLIVLVLTLCYGIWSLVKGF